MINGILNNEKRLIKDLVDTLDKKLKELIDECNEVEDPDMMGLFDSIEHLTGLGFVTLQAYITAAYGILEKTKKSVLSIGPRHWGGNAIVKIVNDSANYWKHNNEWSIDKSSNHRKVIESTFNSAGFPVNSDYPLSGILAELSSPNEATFYAVFEKLEEWQIEVEKIV